MLSYWYSESLENLCEVWMHNFLAIQNLSMLIWKTTLSPWTCSTTVQNKIYLKESWIASLSLAMTILKIRNVIAKECICTTVAIHFCYLILFYFVVLLYIDYRIYSEWHKLICPVCSVLTQNHFNIDIAMPTSSPTQVSPLCQSS